MIGIGIEIERRMSDGLLIGIVAELITWATMFIGSVFVLMAWARVLFERNRFGHWSIPAGLYAFTASVCMEPLWQVVNDHISSYMQDYYVLGTTLARLITFCFLFIGFALLLISMAALRNDSGPTKNMVMTGTIFLISVYVLGFIGIIIG